MKRLFLSILSTLLLFALAPAVSAQIRFFLEPFNINPNETKSLVLKLDNEEPLYGFQADLKLPEGLEIVHKSDNKPDLTLSERFDDSYLTVSNILTDGTLRFGTFSLDHHPICGNEGPIVTISVKATDNFEGGTLTVSDVSFVNEKDEDVILPDLSLALGKEQIYSLFIPDFTIKAGESVMVEMELLNDSEFTAFQTDLYLPVGLKIVPGSFTMSERGTSGHTVYGKSFDDGRTRIIAFSTDNSSFIGNNGCVVKFQIEADESVPSECVMALRSTICSTPSAVEYILPDTFTNVTCEHDDVIIPGDVNNDGKNDILDLNLLINFLTSGVDEGINIKAADINGDSKVDIVDLNIFINKLIN